jgi:hypothetical protein
VARGDGGGQTGRPVHAFEGGAKQDVSSVMEAHRGRFALLLRPDLEDIPILRAEK